MTQSAPNFLFIMADQMAAPALPVYGHPLVKAPNIEQLASQGVVFDNAYCNLPMCAPSRAAMLTGKLPFSIGMYDNASELPASTPTVMHYLRSMGYRTSLSGKMHFPGPDQLHGYDQRHTTEIYPANFAWTVDWSKGREFRPTNLTMAPVIEAGPAVRTLQMDYDDEVEHLGIQAIYDLARKPDDKPFMLTVSFTHPHSPFVIAQEYWDRYRHDDIDLPVVGPIPLDQQDHLSRNLHYCQARHLFTVTDEHRRNARHAYYGMISYLDDKVGRIVNALEQAGLRDNTVIIYTADHGEMMGERGMWYKQHFFEWACRVPMIVSWPQRFKPSRSRANVSLMDLVPTMLDIAAGDTFQEAIEPFDGTSMLPALRGESEDMADVAIAEFAADGSTGPSRMVKRGQYKYMYLEGEDTLLYDLTADPNEMNNLAGKPEYATIEQQLSDLLFENWDPDRLREDIALSQKRRLTIHRATQGEPSWVNVVRADDETRFVRNSGAADTKARARLPYVSPAKPDMSADVATGDNPD